MLACSSYVLNAHFDFFTRIFMADVKENGISLKNGNPIIKENCLKREKKKTN